MDRMIFIVDDDPFWTALLTKQLNELGFGNIKAYHEGNQSIAQLSLNPGLVFLDYQLQQENGLEVLKQIKKHNPATRIIFCTAYEDLGVAISAMEYGSQDYLLKGNATNQEISRLMAASTRYPATA